MGNEFINDNLPEKLYQLSIAEENRQSTEYLEGMVEIYHYLGTIEQHELEYTDLDYLYKQGRPIVIFKINGLPVPLCFDVYFVKSLSPWLRDKVVEQWLYDKKSNKYSETIHSRPLRQLYIEKRLDRRNHKNYREIISLERLLTTCRKDVKKKILEIRNSNSSLWTGSKRAHAATLAMELPLITKFNFLVVKKQLEQFPERKRSLICLKSIGKTWNVTRDFFENSIKELDLHAKECEEFINEDAELSSTENDEAGLGAYFSLENEKGHYLEDLRDLAKGWNYLKILHIDKIKGTYGTELLNDELTSLKNWYEENQDCGQKHYSHLYYFLKRLQRVIIESADQESPLYKKLECDLRLKKINEKECENQKAWIFDNAISATELYYEAVKEIRNLLEAGAAKAPPEKVEEFSRFECDGQKIDTIKEKVKKLLNRKELQEWQEQYLRLEEDEPTKNEELERLIKLHKEGTRKCHEARIQNTSFYGLIAKGYPDVGECLNVISGIYKIIEEAKELKRSIFARIHRIFRRIKKMRDISSAIRNYYGNLMEEFLVRSILEHKFKEIQAQNYENELSKIEQMDNSDEINVRLELLLRQIVAIPPAKKMKNYLEDYEGMGYSEFPFDLNKNEEHLKDLKTRILEKIPPNVDMSKKYFFQEVQIEKYFAPNVKEDLDLLKESFLDLTCLREEDDEPLAFSYQDLEKRLLKALGISTKGIDREAWLKKNKELWQGKHTKDEVKTILEENAKDLEKLMNETVWAMRQLREFQSELGRQEDLSYLSKTISVEDLRILDKSYHFDSKMPLDEVKRFYILQKNRSDQVNELMQNIIASSGENISKELFKEINKKVYDIYMGKTKEKKNTIHSEKKLKILAYAPSVRDIECTYTAFFLNYCKKEWLLETSCFKGIEKILDYADNGSYTVLMELRRIWGPMRSTLRTWDGRTNHELFKHNRANFFSELKEFTDLLDETRT